MRGWIYVPMLLVTGFLQMTLRGVLPFPDVRIELLFLLGFHVGLHAPARAVVPGFWLAGLARDVFLGSHLGVSTIAYTVVGIIVLGLRRRVLVDHLFTRIGFVFACLFVMGMVRPFAEGGATRVLWGGDAISGVGGAAFLTALVSPFVGWFLRETRFRPWNEPAHHYGLHAV